MALHVSLAAGTYVVGKPAATGFGNPAALSLARGLLASALCLSLTGWAVPRPRFTRGEWLQVLGLGTLLVPLNQYLFLVGLRDTVPSHAALIYAMTPAGVLLAQSALERRSPPRVWILGVVVALAGVALVLEPWAKDESLAAVRRGDFAILAGLGIWVAYTLWASRLARATDPRTVTVWTLVLGTAVFLPFAAAPLAATDFSAIPADAWWGLVWLAAVTSTVMMLLWNSLLRHLAPVQVAICANAQPAATALLAAALSAVGFLEGDQRLGTVFWAGTAMVVLGVVMLQARVISRRPSARRGTPR